MLRLRWLPYDVFSDGKRSFQQAEERKETPAPAPRGYSLLVVLAAVLSIAAFTAQLWSQTPQQSPSQTPPTPSSEVGQQLFNSSCAGCHGLDGRGGEHAPNIATIPRVQNLSDNGIMRIVHDGIQSAGMPGFGSRFNDGQIKAIVRYLRVLQGRQAAVSLPGNPRTGVRFSLARRNAADAIPLKARAALLRRISPPTARRIPRTRCSVQSQTPTNIWTRDSGPSLPQLAMARNLGCRTQ